jgi:uncharacterized membrane protein
MLPIIRFAAGAAAMTAGLSIASAAEAGFDICNQTKDEITVAFGYRENGDWTSAGWYNIAPGECATVYDKSLQERYYYYYAEQVNGNIVWEGETANDVFCATDEAFTIVGDSNCKGRGYQPYKFRIVDVGEEVDYGIDLIE